MYPRVIQLKQMFATFFPQFKSEVIRDDDAWKLVDTNNMYWADEALNLKRNGDYVSACRLYFDQILWRGRITNGWAAGIFKTLASAGDIGDAVVFGFEWYTNYANQAHIDSDNLVMHLGNVIALVKGNQTMSFSEYLKAISGNPNYSIDMLQTDLYTDKVLCDMRANP